MGAAKRCRQVPDEYGSSRDSVWLEGRKTQGSRQSPEASGRSERMLGDRPASGAGEDCRI
jgi:hypothetical protein